MSSLNRREFARLTGAGLAGSLLSFPALTSAATGGSVPQPRLDRLAKGANVCQWFRFVRQEGAAHFDNYITEAEAGMMRQMGLTHVRLCLQPKVIMDQTTGAVREENAKFLDAAIERFHRAGLLVVVNLHNEDRPSELNPAWQDAFVRFWGDFAGRLKHFDPELTLLEIINEPVFDGREDRVEHVQWPVGGRHSQERARTHDHDLGPELGRPGSALPAADWIVCLPRPSPCRVRNRACRSPPFNPSVRTALAQFGRRFKTAIWFTC